MFLSKRLTLLLIVVSAIAAVLLLHGMGRITPTQMQQWLQVVGIWAPICYIALYILVTIAILPLTPLNLLAGAVFGFWGGMGLSTIAAILSGSLAFGFSRTIGRDFVAQKLSHRWQKFDTEISQGGPLYVFAICLFPILPYGLFSFAAGLTAIRFRDYFYGIALAMTPGILPFALLGSSGIKAINTGEILPLLGALGLTAIVVGGTTWYQRRRSRPSK